jgi:hypothetical protein
MGAAGAGAGQRRVELRAAVRRKGAGAGISTPAIPDTRV